MTALHTQTRETALSATLPSASRFESLAGLLVLLALLLGAGCDQGEGEPTPTDPWAEVDLAELWRLGSRGLSLCEQHRFEEASEAWAQVIELAPFWYTARINLGISKLNEHDGGEDEAHAIFQEVLAEFPDAPWPNYCMGVLLERAGLLEDADRHYRAVLAVDSTDPDTLMRLGLTLQARGQHEEARTVLTDALRQDNRLITAWYAVRQTASALGDTQLEDRATKRFAELRGTTHARESAIVFGKMGFYASPIRSEDWEAPAPPAGVPATAVPPSFADASEEAGLTRDELRHGGPGSGFFSGWVANATAAANTEHGAETSGGVAVVDRDLDGDVDVFAAQWGDAPDVLALDNDGEGHFTDVAAALGLDGEGPARTISVATADFDGDGFADLFLGRDGVDFVLAQDTAGAPYSRRISGAEGLPIPTFSVAIGDLDLDGDLDLVTGSRRGLALHRFNGREFEDATLGSGLDLEAPGYGVLLADVDGDDDVDIVSGAPRVQLARNDRLWRFRRTDQPIADRPRMPVASWALGDVDGDGVVDLLAATPSNPTALYFTDAEEGFRLDTGFEQAGSSQGFSGFLLDADRDGDLDVLVVGAQPGLMLRNASGAWADATEASGFSALGPALEAARGSALLDADGDGDLDVFVVRNGDTPLLLRNDTEPTPDWIAVNPQGIRDRGAARGRTLGHGAMVEVVTMGKTQVAHSGLGGGFGSVAPNTLFFTLAGEDRADVRIRWADLVLQTEVELGAGETHVIEQVDREASSCPVVFYWNGERFAYRADFLGSGGLGFLLEPGVFGAPDPEEVLLLGEDLAPRDGMLEVRVTEPMEETSFLDRARLIRVTHPEGTRAIPEERFATDGRLASGRVLIVREDELVSPSRAEVVSLEAIDVHHHLACEPDPGTAAQRLADADRQYAGPPALHRRLRGFATEWALELTFPADALARTEGEIYLFARGWVEYPYSRLNYSAWQGGLVGEAPSLEIPDLTGGSTSGWRTVRPRFGYMGGKDRTLALPIREHLEGARVGDELRFRLRTNLPVYFDRIYLAPDRAETDLVEVLELEPASAVVGACGFPVLDSPDGQQPDLYDFSSRTSWTDFKSMPGTYTRFGEARELLLDADDRFAIIGAGEEVVLRFEPPAPPSEGLRTTWMLDARGYCKDMCPLSSNPNTVEPLPFAAMTNYPPEEPLGAAHPSRTAAQNHRLVPHASGMSGGKP